MEAEVEVVAIVEVGVEAEADQDQDLKSNYIFFYDECSNLWCEIKAYWNRKLV